MTEKDYKLTHMKTPVENHDTAALAPSIESNKPISNVTIPSEEAVRNAKDWVDANQK